MEPEKVRRKGPGYLVCIVTPPHPACSNRFARVGHAVFPERFFRATRAACPLPVELELVLGAADSVGAWHHLRQWLAARTTPLRPPRGTWYTYDEAFADAVNTWAPTAAAAGLVYPLPVAEREAINARL